jgi:uncharacterized membrane protein
MEKTSIGLNENVAGLLCYILGWVSGLVFLLIESENKFVRFHALQSIIVFGALTVIQIIVGWIPVLGAILVWIIGIIMVIMWIVLMVKAYQGTRYKAPWAGNLAEKWVGEQSK